MRIASLLALMCIAMSCHAVEYVSFNINGHRVVGVPGADGGRTAIVSRGGTAYVYARPGAITDIRPLRPGEKDAPAAAPSPSPPPAKGASAVPLPADDGPIVDEAYLHEAYRAFRGTMMFPLKIYSGRVAAIALDPSGGELIGLENGEVWMQMGQTPFGRDGHKGGDVYIHPILSDYNSTIQIDPDHYGREIIARRIK